MCASQGLFNSKKHNRLNSKGQNVTAGEANERSAHGNARYTGPTPVAPMEDFDLLSREKPQIFHKYAVELRARALDCFYIYVEDTYKIDVGIEGDNNKRE